MTKNLFAAVLAAAVASLAGCGGGSGGDKSVAAPPPAPTYGVSGGISGLTGTAVVALSVNGAAPSSLSVNADGAFDFPQPLTSGQNYAVTLQAQPADQNCRVNNATGVIGTADITNVTVTCTPATSSVGGSITGLNGTVVLGITTGGVSGTALSATNNGSFTFSQLVAAGASYAVSVQTQPPTQNCTVTNATGVIAAANVTNVFVSCTAASFSIGGGVAGLNGTLVLGIRAGGVPGPALTVNSNGPFAFSQLVASGLGYAVSVQSQPAAQGCTVSNGRGVISAANVADVAITCTPGPSAPAVTARPGNAQATLAWPAVPNATAYNVYVSPTSPVTTASPKITVSGAGTSVPALANGTPAYAAVSAVGAAGESALSSEVCAVPTAASNAGLTLYDPLCSGTLAGTKWQSPLFSRGVANGAMVLSTHATDMESNSTRGLFYTTPAFVNAGGRRVTTLETDVVVPQASVSRSGASQGEALVRLTYQPPANRLAFPGANLDLLAMRVGLRVDGAGLRAFREVVHCDDASCTSRSTSGIAFADPAGFSGDAPAAYDTSYRVTAALDETTGVLTWSIVGGSLNLAGSANPAAYLAGNANWATLGANPLSTGFLNAILGSRVIDSAGGSSGSISGRFDDVKVGFDNAPATLWDDFSAVSGNSGPTELSSLKWTLNPGMSSMSLAGGALVGHAQATTATSASLAVFNSLPFSDPTAINTIQADFTVSACSNSLFGTNRAGLTATLYNDGTPGTSAPDINQPNSRVGDIVASLFIDCTLDDVLFQVARFDTNGSQSILSSSANAVVPKGAPSVLGNTHTLMMKWDPTSRQLTFQADGQAPVVVDPKTVNARMQTAAPYVKPANAPNKSLNWLLVFPASSSGPAKANVTFEANNVFTAP